MESLLRIVQGFSVKRKSTALGEKKARPNAIFQGIEHVGLYPRTGVASNKIADWYVNTFGLAKAEGKSSTFLNSCGNPGRIEVLREPSDRVKCHIAVRVSDFEEACRILKEKGIELEEPFEGDPLTAKKGTKSVYIKGLDPAGNRVHLIYVP
jgi:hypothetical protein